MSQASNGDTVKIHYTGTLEDGVQFDSSAGREPLEFTIGSGQVIPGFESAVTGMAVGDKKNVCIAPVDAYGERNEEMVQEVPRDVMPEDVELEIGMPLQAQGPDGQVFNLTVIGLGENSVHLDGNHPLAGKALAFDIELVEIGGSVIIT